MDELSQKLGHPPTDVQIAESLRLSVDEYRKLLFETNATILVSLDDSLSSEHGDAAMLADLTADTASASSQERLEERELHSIIVLRLKDLPDQEKLVLALYYYEELTFKEIGQVLDLTESRVSQIHSAAIGDLRIAVERSVNS